MKAEIVFLAGASGAIGKSLVPQLVDAGYTVFGTTRFAERARDLEDLGAKPIVVDVFNHSALRQALLEIRPAIVVNQLTDLPKMRAGPLSEQVLKSNARLRELGTRNLIEAALGAGARHLIAQSLAWVYAPGPTPHGEEDPLDANAGGTAAITNLSVIALEWMTLNSPPLAGVVLRYGQFYGPSTWNTAQNGSAPVHVDAAARAAVLAITAERVGTYNIAEEQGLVSTEKARRELGWSADFRMHSPELA
ncbi:MAG TPA: NAD(P)-dependent oxidoreductase [Steroidobacteraceae bacterium]|jgi:nucleoside-diphosphate-sugar epimerase|nr:NAD(P)-dependent oxidoreductase [Steroidobacteraceae bacterium]